MNPPPPPFGEAITTRLFAGPALRMQSDGRLVNLVRDGNEPAFEEIVRRYGKALHRYAAAIVTRQRAEDVSQDAFTKAFVALKGSDKEIKLRPWLYRIVRNTALNELRDSTPQGVELDERAPGGEEPADTLERRQRVEALMAGLAELPEPQRAAIVMRELEGLSHEQIAKSLGVSGGAVRQSIYRARTALRDGAGMLVPLPLLRFLAGGMGPDAATGAAAGGAGVSLGIAAKAGVATLLVAGTGVAGVAIEQHRHAPSAAERAATRRQIEDSSIPGAAAFSARSQRNRGPGSGGEDHRGSHHGDDNAGPGSSNSGTSGRSSGDGGGGSGGFGSGSSGASGSGSSGSGSSGTGSGSSDSGTSGSGSGGSGSGSSGSSGGGDDIPSF
ncbi:MAG: RNA polymerase sigma factor [Solirubrobacterales bacterium]